MGYLLPALTDAEIRDQRDVVLNERRQNYENRPYGLATDGACWRRCFRRTIRTTGRRSARSPISRRRRSTTCTSSSGPTTTRRMRRWSLAGDIDHGRRARARASSTSTRFRPGPSRLPRRPDGGARPASGGCCSRIASSCRGCTCRGYAGDVRRRRRRIDLAVRSARQRQDLAPLSKRSSIERRIATEVTAFQNSREIAGFLQVAGDRRARPHARRARAGDRRGARAADRRGPDRRRDRARPRAGRSAVRVPAADARRFRGKPISSTPTTCSSDDPGYFERDLARYAGVTAAGSASTRCGSISAPTTAWR